MQKYLKSIGATALCYYEFVSVIFMFVENSVYFPDKASIEYMQKKLLFSLRCKRFLKKKEK